MSKPPRSQYENYPVRRSPADAQNPSIPLPPAVHPGEPLQADLKAFLDGELSPLARLRVRLHLAVCAACREELTWLQRLGEDMQDLEKATPRPELRARILAALPDAPPARIASSATSRPPLRVTTTRSPVPAFGNGWRLAGAGSLLVLGGILALARPFGQHDNTTTVPLSSLSPSRVVANVKPKLATPARVGRQAVTQAAVSKTPERTSLREADDPTSDLANRIFQQRERAERNRESRLRQIAWNRAVSQQRFAVSRLNASPAPMRVILGVANPRQAQQSLLAWARRAGGQLTLASSSPQNGSAAMGAPTLSPDTVALTLNVPASHAAGLAAVLQKNGSWALASTAVPSVSALGVAPVVPVAESKPTALASHSAEGTQPGEATTKSSVHPEIEPYAKASASRVTAFPAQPPVPSRPGWITISIQMHPLHSLTR